MSGAVAEPEPIEAFSRSATGGERSGAGDAGAGATGEGAERGEQVAEGFQVSPQQERILELEGAAESFFARMGVDIRGPLDLRRFLAAFSEVTARQEMLRATFHRSPDGSVLQVVREDAEPALRLVDLSSLPAQRLREAVIACARSQAYRKVDLTRGPLADLCLFSFGTDRWFFLFHLPALCADVWSLGRLFQEIATCYEELRELAPHERPMPYTQFSTWQRQLLELEEAEAERAFWAAGGPRSPVDVCLPYELPVSGGPPPIPGSQSAVLSNAVREQLAHAVRRVDAQEEAILLAVWRLLLERLSGQHRATILRRCSGRDYEEIEATCGVFEKHLPLDLEVDWERSFGRLARRLQSRIEEGEDWQEYFDSRLVDPADDGKAAGFAYGRCPAPVRTGGAYFSIAGLFAWTEPLKVQLHVLDRGTDLRCEIFFDRRRWTGDDARLLLRRFETLLGNALAAPHLPVRQLDYLELGERRQVLSELNRTVVFFTGAEVLHERFDAVCERHGDETAACFEGETLSYRELQQRANQVAGHLVDLGIRQGDLVGVSLHRSLRLPVALLGVLKAGAGYVPLDPDYPDERLALMVEDGGLSLLITESSVDSSGWAGSLAAVPLDGEGAAIGGRPATAPEISVGASDLAYGIYTSGSTGRPKAALCSHGAIVNRLQWMQEEMKLEAGEGVLHKTPYSFDVSVWELFWPLLVGARLIIARPGGHRDPAYLARLITRERVTTAHFVPSMLTAFLEEPELAAAGLSLQRVVCSGEVLSSGLRDHFFEKFEARLYNLYGPTEAAVDVTSWECRRGVRRDVVPVGRPIANNRVFLLDRWGDPVARGLTGEICLSGAGLARGYLNRPALTAASFVPDPFSGLPGSRLYRTGDRGRWGRDNVLEFAGRSDNQVKIRGHRVEPTEVEAQLSRHPEMRSAAVVAGRDPRGAHRLVAYVVPRSSARHTAGASPESLLDDSLRLDQAGLRRYLGRSLPEFLIPSVFILLEEMPLLPSGKVDRASLPEANVTVRERHQQPASPLERVLASIWSEVLRVPVVGTRDDFLALGGDSILAMQIVARAKRYGIHLVPTQLFELSTVEELAKAAGEAKRQTVATVQGPAPLAPIQRWFFDQGFERPEQWNQAVLLQARGPLDEGLLAAILARLEAAHGALRLRFSRTPEGEWVQEEAAPREAGLLTTVDLRDLPGEERELALEAVLADLNGSLNLSRGPLWRAAYLRTAGEGDFLALVIHHLAVDGVSWRVLLDDLDELLQDPAAAAGALLPSSSYLAWASSQRQETAEVAAAWSSQAWQGVAPLPRDSAMGEARFGNRVADEETVEVSLSAAETNALVGRIPRGLRADLEEILLSALGRAVGRWAGREAVLVCLEGHGRDLRSETLDLTRTVGWFTALFPVVLEMPREGSRVDDVRAVRDLLARLPADRASFGRLAQDPASGELFGGPEDRPQPELLFNFLGHLDSVLQVQGPLVPTQRPVGPVRHPENHRPFLLEINAWISEGKLGAAWTFNRRIHQRSTLEDLAEAFLAQLRGLIATDLASLAVTADHFPGCGLSGQQLEVLVEEAGGFGAVEDVHRLSPTQEGMLFHLLVHHETEAGEGRRDRTARSTAGEPFFNQLHCELRGAVDVEAFRSSWQRTMDRHRMLRAEVHWRQLPHPVLLVRPEGLALSWQEMDWRSRAREERDGDLESYLAEDRARGFDLSAAPLFRLSLIQLSEGRWRFVFSYHHLMLDGWSVSLLLKEVFGRYESTVCELPWSAEEAPPYSSFVTWAREQDEEQAREFWQQALAGLEEPTRLLGSSMDRAVERIPRRLRRTLGEAATTALRRASRNHRLTPNTWVQGAWALVLHEQSMADEVLFGAVVSGRETGFASSLGLFINALPVRARVDRSEPVQPWLAALQQKQVGQRRFEWCPVEQIHSWTEFPRDGGLFHSLVVFENYPVEDSLLKGQGGLRVRSLEVEESTNYPLALFVFPGDELRFDLGYDAARVDRATAETLMDRLEALLVRLVEGADGPLGEILEPGAEDAEELLRPSALARTQGPSDASQTVHALFEKRAAQDPAAPCVMEARMAGPKGSSSKAWTYGKVNRRANQLAHELVERGVRPGMRVALRLERSAETLAMLLAVLKTGAAYVPLDLGWPSERCRQVLEDCGAVMLVTERALSTVEPPAPVKLFFLDVDGAEVSRRSVENPGHQVRSGDLAYVIYTSGSQGKPKGVMTSHRGLSLHSLAAASGFRLSSKDRVLQFASLAFDASAEEIFPTLARGAALVLRDEAMLSSAGAFWDACDRCGVTVVDLPTAFWHQLTADPAAPERLPQSLRLVIVGGEAASAERLGQWHDRYRDTVRLVNTYGPTECTVVAARADLPAGASSEGDALVAVPIGRPLDHVRAYVLDQRGKPLPPGVPGELYLGGPGLARGYLGVPRGTAGAFVPDPFGGEAGGRLYRTGDLVRWLPDGQLLFLQRADAQVKIRGYRVEPAEIELALEDDPAVREAAVVLTVEGGEPRLMAVVAGDDPEPDRLRENLRRVLPEYMVPADWRITDGLPRTAGGKIDRRAVLRLRSAPSRLQSIVPPRNETERVLAEIFIELLEVERVGVHESFFDLGGHSLLATRLIARVREVFEIELALRSVFELPTVAELAAEVASLILDQLEGLEEEDLEYAEEDPAQAWDESFEPVRETEPMGREARP